VRFSRALEGLLRRDLGQLGKLNDFYSSYLVPYYSDVPLQPRALGFNKDIIPLAKVDSLRTQARTAGAQSGRCVVLPLRGHQLALTPPYTERPALPLLTVSS
jgi:hypothetical protein